MTILTALRTAATSAMAARTLMPKGAKVMTLIGNGAQSEFLEGNLPIFNGVHP